MALRTNAHHLNSLELDLNCIAHCDTWSADADTYWFKSAWRTLTLTSELNFPLLKHLSFSRLDLEDWILYGNGCCAYGCSSHSLDQLCLKSLVLRQCPGLIYFLAAMMKSSCLCDFCSLEVVQPQAWTGSDYDDCDFVHYCLEPLQALELENLYLSIPDPSSAGLIWDAASNMTSLRRFIFHVRGIQHGEVRDTSDMAFSQDTFRYDVACHDQNPDPDAPLFSEEFPNALGKLDLECIGVSCDTRHLVMSFHFCALSILFSILT